MLKIINDGLTPGLHRMLYSCTRMATVGVKGLKLNSSQLVNAITLDSARTGLCRMTCCR